MKPDDLHAVIGPDFHRLFAGIQTQEAPMPDFIAPDLGHPFQHATPPEPVEFDMTTDELSEARKQQDDIERNRNKRCAHRHNRRPRGGDDPEAA